VWGSGARVEGKEVHHGTAPQLWKGMWQRGVGTQKKRGGKLWFLWTPLVSGNFQGEKRGGGIPGHGWVVFCPVAGGQENALTKNLGGETGGGILEKKKGKKCNLGKKTQSVGAGGQKIGKKVKKNSTERPRPWGVKDESPTTPQKAKKKRNGAKKLEVIKKNKALHGNREGKKKP